jgi:hypothetical protein
VGELGIRKILLPKEGNDPFETGKFEQFKNKINQAVFYMPFLVLLFLSVSITFFLNSWLNFFVLYASMILTFAVVLFGRNRWKFWLVMILTLVYRVIPLFNVSVLLSTDILQYGYFGTKILKGLMPYRSFDAPYPPLSLYVTVPFVMLGDLRFLKALFSFCDVLIVFIVYNVFLRNKENANTISILFLLFPVSLVEYSISGHNDSLTLLLSIASLALLDKNVVGSSVLMALSILCKLFPIVLIPFVLKQLFSKNKKSAFFYALTLISVLGFISLPFVLLSWEGYINMIIGLTRYSVPYGVSVSVFLFLLGDLGQQSIMFSYMFATLLVAVFCALVFFISCSHDWPLTKSCSVCLLVLPFLLPQFQPWYLLWAFPFVMISGSSNLKLTKLYLVLFLFFHVLCYLLFSFSNL